MTAASTISPKYQVSIPKALRERLNWRPGQKLAFIPKGDGLLMIPVPNREDLIGIARGAKAGD
jgi:AbrB family looped-hinge helix DNA binding protein